MYTDEPPIKGGGYAGLTSNIFCFDLIFISIENFIGNYSLK